MFANRSILRIFPVLFNVAIMLALLIGSAAFPISVRAASTITVTTSDDNTTTDTVCSLREAIINANADGGLGTSTDCTAGSGADTIVFVDGIATVLLGSTLPTITDPNGLTINGGGDVTVSGDDLSRVFIVSAQLTVDNLTVAHGKVISAVAGGIYNSGTLTITNSTFSGNSAVLGGGIYSLGTLTITNSTFSGNSSTYGAAVNSSNGTLTITNSIFSGNSTSSGGGAVVYIYSTATITNSTFTNNTVGTGSLYNDGTLTITNSTFSGNSATNSGAGGIYNGSDGVMTAANNTFSGNSATNYGGGVYNYGTATISNSTFSGNSAVFEGGAIYQDASATLNLYNNILANSSAGGDCALAFGATAAGNNNLIEDATAACGFTDGLNGDIIGSDPNLGALTGSPAYFPLNSGSLAIDAGDDAKCAAAPVSNTSQNGVARPQGTHCDIGSFELVSPITTTTITYDGPDPSRVGQASSVGVTVTGGATLPTGTVDITGADSNCTITLSGGMGSCMVSFASTGPKTLTATYNGDGSHDPSSDTEGHTAVLAASFRSIAADDGWILESTETSGMGGTLNAAATTFNLGDDATNRQYRAILHFDTSGLPDAAVITKVTLKIRKQGLVGVNPFTVLGGLLVDMRKPSFGAAALAPGDFQAVAGRSTVATFGATPLLNWYSALLNATGRNYVNKTGTTQFRLRFATDDNNNNLANTMRFFSGNAAVASRPQLIIEYTIP